MAIDITKFALSAHGPCPECEAGRVLIGPPGTMPTSAPCPRCGGTGVLNFVIALADLPSVIAEAQQSQQPVIVEAAPASPVPDETPTATQEDSHE